MKRDRVEREREEEMICLHYTSHTKLDYGGKVSLAISFADSAIHLGGVLNTLSTSRRCERSERSGSS